MGQPNKPCAVTTAGAAHCAQESESLRGTLSRCRSMLSDPNFGKHPAACCRKSSLLGTPSSAWPFQFQTMTTPQEVLHGAVQNHVPVADEPPMAICAACQEREYRFGIDMNSFLGFLGPAARKATTYCRLWVVHRKDALGFLLNDPASLSEAGVSWTCCVLWVIHRQQMGCASGPRA